ncbi:MAG TPA: FG-GAP repeat protein, partial [Steroidobacteraceae bacterium]
SILTATEETNMLLSPRGPILVGVLVLTLLISQPTAAQETPVIGGLSTAHASTSATWPFVLFGQAVAIEGRLALVGVPNFVATDADEKIIQGPIVEIYAGNADGTLWTRTGSLSAPDPKAEGFFGSALALTGNRLAVGSFGPLELFERRKSRWVRRDSISFSPPFSGPGRFAYEGDTLAMVVGEHQMDSIPGSQNRLFVYIYRIEREGKAHRVQRLEIPAAGIDSLALDHELLVVGSSGGYDPVNPQPPGQVYVYSRRGEHWRFEQTIPSPTGAPNSEFGQAVALGDRAILVSAPREDFEGDRGFTFAEGELYVFRKAHGVWAETQETRPSAGFADFGAVLAAGGGRVAVGSPFPTDPFQTEFGPTVIYRWDGDTLVLDNYVVSSRTVSLDISRNRIIVGENAEVKNGANNAAEVLTYPRAADSDDSQSASQEDED